MGVDGVLVALTFAWFGVHIGFPRDSHPSRAARVLLALTFLQLVVYYAITRGART